MSTTLLDCTFINNEVSGGTRDAGAAIAVFATNSPAVVHVRGSSSSSSSGVGCLLADNAVLSGRQYWYMPQLSPLQDPGMQWFTDPAAAGNVSLTVAANCTVSLRCEQYLSCGGCTRNTSCG